MLIWLNLIIPTIAIIILVIKFNKKMVWWEYVLLYAVSIVIIAISGKVSTSTQTADKEVWNSQLMNAEYTESWETWVDETCYEDIYDGEGNVVGQRSYDCSYCDRYSPTWTSYDSNGKRHSISPEHFDRLCSLWKVKDFNDQNRNIDFDGTCGKDGDVYSTRWDGTFEGVEDVAIQHTYENRIQASRSVFKYSTVDSATKKDYGLYEYPLVSKWDYNPILGGNDPKASSDLSKWNAKMGPFKQVHMLIAVFKDKPLEAAIEQENLWQGGNKNEVVLCLGLDKKDSLVWSHVISWTDKELFKIILRDTVMTTSYDLQEIVPVMAGVVNKFYIRKQFKDFSYLQIEPSTRAILVTFIITILLVTGLSIFFVNNEFDQGGRYGVLRRRY